MLKGVTSNVLNVEQGGTVLYAAAKAITAPCCFGITTGQYGELQIRGAGNIVQEFSGEPYLMLTVIDSTGVPQYRRIPLLPWTPV